MTRTLSTMLRLGTKAPEFSLPDVVSGKTISLDTFKGKKALLVMFICRHCPYVKHVQQEIARIGRDYASKDVGIVAISSNDPESYPEDSPSSLKEMAFPGFLAGFFTRRIPTLERWKNHRVAA